MTPRPGAVVVGTGFGCRVHVPALRAAGFEVRALVGRDPGRTARRAARLGVPNACTDLATACALSGTEVVTIATPPATHAPLAVEALEHGRHVLCEKPFAASAPAARAMVDAADRAGTVALVGHEFRWAPERAVIGRAIAEGRIGTPRVASFVQYVALLADPEAQMPAWWFDPAAGGGWLGASGSHQVDQARVWLGDVASVSARLGRTAERAGAATDAEDTFTIRATFAGGCDVVLQQSAGAWGPAAGITRVAGTEGAVWLDGDTAWLAGSSGAAPLPVPAELALPTGPSQVDDGALSPAHRFTHLELGPYTRLCEALRARIAGGVAAEPVPVPTFADGLACTEVLEAVRVSAAADGERVIP